MRKLRLRLSNLPKVTYERVARSDGKPGPSGQVHFPELLLFSFLIKKAMHANILLRMWTF